MPDTETNFWEWVGDLQRREPPFKVGDLVRFKYDHPDVPKTPFQVVETGLGCVGLGASCWYGEGAFELVKSEND